jgi:putative MFS transporter
MALNGTGGGYLYSELAKARGRGRFVLLFEIIFPVGIVMAALLGRWIVPNLGWQYMFYIGGLPALLALFLLRLLPESPQAGGRTSEATETLAFIEKEVEKATLAPLPNIGPLAESVETKRASWADLFGPVYLGRTSLLWLCWFATYLVNYGLTTWLPSVYQQVFKFAAGAGTLFSSFLCAIFIDRVGRRIFGSVWWFRCQAADALVDWADHAGTCARAHHTQLYVHQQLSLAMVLYTAEMYPTRMRALGSGAGTAWLRVASIVGPLVVGNLVARGDLGTVFLAFGETQGRVLEEVSP